MDRGNRVSRSGDGTVVKHHGGPSGAQRTATAAAALRAAAGHDLPVPRVVGTDGDSLTMADVDGTATGATVLGRAPTVVLREVGTFAARLHALPPPQELTAGPDVDPGPDAVWVHGDLCPVNLLFDEDDALVAVVDWEDSHVGDPLVDLVWTEWLVRAWHDAAVPQLAILYEAYGGPVPAAADRRRSMAACLVRQGARTTDPVAQAAWDRRIVGLGDLDLTL